MEFAKKTLIVNKDFYALGNLAGKFLVYISTAYLGEKEIYLLGNGFQSATKIVTLTEQKKVVQANIDSFSKTNISFWEDRLRILNKIEELLKN